MTGTADIATPSSSEVWPPDACRPDLWHDAMTALALFAIDPVGTVGIRLRARAGPVRDRFMACLAACMPEGKPVRKMPSGIAPARLLGGLDLAATLAAGRPIAERGLLAEADGGIIAVAMAERLPAGTAALVAAALDAGEVFVERDGLTLHAASRFGVVLIDEGVEDDERPPKALTERLAFDLDLTSLRLGDTNSIIVPVEQVAAARDRLASIEVAPAIITAFCETAASLGVGSVRADLLALAAARAAAALAGRSAVETVDAQLAARLVFASRATQFPAPPTSEAAQPETASARSDPEQAERDPGSDEDRPIDDLTEILRDAVGVALPPELLARVRLATSPKAAKSDGRAGGWTKGGQRGRRTGARAGMPRGGARLDLLETLRASAPWQKLRTTAATPVVGRVLIRASDLRISRFKSKQRTTVLFVVDASGSQALNRLAEAKGAVELLLADCYVRRDQVAVIAFRGTSADVILPPTHSLTRAKRMLAGLPGGGGTPLATAIDASAALAAKVRRSGETPLAVFLTDGQANIGRDGKGGRRQAEADAILAARGLRAGGYASLLIDTAPRPGQRGRDIAAAMGGTYIALPQAGAAAVAGVLKEAAAALA